HRLRSGNLRHRFGHLVRRAARGGSPGFAAAGVPRDERTPGAGPAAALVGDAQARARTAAGLRLPHPYSQNTRTLVRSWSTSTWRSLSWSSISSRFSGRTWPMSNGTPFLAISELMCSRAWGGITLVSRTPALSRAMGTRMLTLVGPLWPGSSVSTSTLRYFGEPL